MTRNDPRVVQVTSGRFHQFDLARQLEKRGLLAAIYTGYPRWKLRGEGLPAGKIRTWPWMQVPFMAGGGRGLRAIGAEEVWRHWNRVLIDRHAARTLDPGTDVLVAMSGHGSNCGRKVQAGDGSWICVRGSTHVRHQERVLRDEYSKWGLTYSPLPASVVAREEFEYAGCDRIAVPSRQVWDTFVANGLPAERLALVPYGVDLTRFQPVDSPVSGEFQILFAGGISVRKGVGHLIEAFRRVRHPRKKLILAGTAGPDARALLRRAPEGVVLQGHCSQPRLRELMSRSHVFALCSIEEGMANVLGQALACGCPVIATAATGAADLFEDGDAGYILAQPDPGLIAQRLEAFAQDPELRRRMSERALERVRSIGGWDRYGDIMEALIRSLWRPRNRA